MRALRVGTIPAPGGPTRTARPPRDRAPSRVRRLAAVEGPAVPPTPARAVRAGTLPVVAIIENRRAPLFRTRGISVLLVLSGTLERVSPPTSLTNTTSRSALGFRIGSASRLPHKSGTGTQQRAPRTPPSTACTRHGRRRNPGTRTGRSRVRSSGTGVTPPITASTARITSTRRRSTPPTRRTYGRGAEAATAASEVSGRAAAVRTGARKSRPIPTPLPPRITGACASTAGVTATGPPIPGRPPTAATA